MSNNESTLRESNTADGSSIMSNRASWESARAIDTTCLAAGRISPTSRFGSMSSRPNRPSSSRASTAARRPAISPPDRRSWPRKMLSATDSASTRSSSW